MQEKSGVKCFCLIFGETTDSGGFLEDVRADITVERAIVSVSVYLEDRHALSFHAETPLNQNLVSSPLALLVAVSGMIETALNQCVELRARRGERLAEDAEKVKEAFRTRDPEGWKTFQRNSEKVKEAAFREKVKEAIEESKRRSIDAIKERIKSAYCTLVGKTDEEIVEEGEKTCKSLFGEGYTLEEITTAVSEARAEWLEAKAAAEGATKN